MATDSANVRRTQLRPVVQVTGTFLGRENSPAETSLEAIRAVLDWLRDKQRVLLPDSAGRGESFEVDAAEGLPVAAVRFDNYWALHFDKFDPDVPGRIWRTEATVAHTETSALGGVRLSVLDAEPGFDFIPSIPTIVRTWAQRPGLADYGEQLTDAPTLVSTNEQLDRLVRLLVKQDRSRPVLVFSEGKAVDAFGEASRAAYRLAGTAHVFVLPDAQHQRLSDRVGREFSVWGAAVRTYLPGFDPAVDEVTKHPPATREWLVRRFRSIDQFFDVLLRSYTSLSIKRTGIDVEMPSFRTVKQASLSYQLARLPLPKTDERAQFLDQENALLRQQIQEKTDEFNYADTEVTAAQEERDQYRAQVMALRAQIQRLEALTREVAAPVEFPSSLAAIDTWVLEQYPGRLLLLNRAARAAKKSPFNEPPLVYRCIDRLAKQYVDARREGKTVDSLFDDLGVGLERTGDADRLRQWKEKYFVPHRGVSQFLEWHLKKGADHNEATTMRIYFFYDEDDEQVIVGHLPGHLTNSQT